MGSRSRRLLLPLAVALASAAASTVHAEPASSFAPSASGGSATPSFAPSASGGSATRAGKPPSGKASAKSTAKAANPPNPSAKNALRPPADVASRRQIAGGPTVDDVLQGADTPELRALHAAERELFPPASAALGSPWPQELPFPLASTEDRPRVHASGLPPAPVPSKPEAAEGKKDLGWLSTLDMPEIPVRWDPRVIRYLEFFKDDPRGRTTFTIWLKRSGRYRNTIAKILRQKGLPADLSCLAMIESGFDATARSPVGALGLWQFMPETGRLYGLTSDRWADQRMSAQRATEAAADFLLDLHRRFGSWDLAMAAYNMGFGGMLAVVRRYNTNDFWTLSRLEGSLPWETTLYVPKILASAIVLKNLAAFGYQDVAPEPPLEGEDVPVRPGTTLAAVARACGTTAKEIEQLNPELRASRTPPVQEDWPVRVPLGKASACSQNLIKGKKEPLPLERYVVRFGESLEQIAQGRRVSVAKLVELNAIAPGEVVRGGTLLLVPKVDGPTERADDHKEAPSASAPPASGGSASASAPPKPVVVVPQDIFVYPDKRRVFYRVQIGDTVREIAEAFGVSADDLRRWNTVDTSARLVEGMTLQLFVRREKDLSRVVVLGDGDVRTVVVGTDEFFQHWEDRGRRRVVVTAKAGDTLDSIGKKHGVTTAMMERINRRGRSETLADGEQIVVWVPPKTPSAAIAAGDALRHDARAARSEPDATPALAEPPAPDLLPALP